VSTHDKCPHCGALLEYGESSSAWWSSCGSTGKKQSDLCRERAARQKAEALLELERNSSNSCGRVLAAMLGVQDPKQVANAITQLKADLAAAKEVTRSLSAASQDLAQKNVALESDISDARAEWSKLIDTLDLMRDEFRRIQARIGEQEGSEPTGVLREIYYLCARALSGIPQRVPVIQQRDDAERRVRELEVKLETAISTVTAINGGFMGQVHAEIKDARAKHAPINSAHEGYSVILEELDEFWEEVRKKRSDRNPQRMWNELVQVAAMAMRTAEDVVQPKLTPTTTEGGARE
jgi:chromosome segregation ATPase